MTSDISKTLSSLNEQPLSYKLNIATGIVGVIVAVVIFIVAARPVGLAGVEAPSGPSTPAQIRAETASLRAETEKLAADLKSIQADLREVAALPKDAKLAIQQQQTQRAIKDLAERQEKLEQIIVSNPAKALELSLLQRDVENVKVVQQTNLAEVTAVVDRIYSLIKWTLAAMAVSLVMLALSNVLKGNER